MIRNYYLAAVLTFVLLGTGCSNEEILLPSENPVQENEIGEGFCATVPPYEFNDGTRLSIDQSLKVFNWSDGDKIAVYYSDGQNSAAASFTIEQGGSNIGVFKNAGFKLMPNHNYYAFFPFSEGATLQKNPMNYWGQMQKGNGSTAHLGAYNYMYATTTSDANGTAIFTFQNYNAILKFELRVPESGTFTSLTVYRKDEGFIMYKFKGSPLNPDLEYDDDVATHYLLSFGTGIKLNAGDVLTAYLAVPPICGLSGHDLTLELATGVGKVFNADVDGQQLENGKAYRYVATMTNDAYPQVTPAGLKALDMGTSVLWANMNVGAESESDPGYFLAWGERKPKDFFSMSSYKHTSYSGEPLKYKWLFNSSSGYLEEYLAPEDDPATVYWGKDWRMPTMTELIELINACSIKFSSSSAVFTHGNNTLTIPLIGHHDEYGYMYESMTYMPARDKRGYDAQDQSWYLGTQWSSFSTYLDKPYFGTTVRAVYDPTVDQEFVDLGLPSGTLWAKCNVGATRSGERGDFFAWGDSKPKGSDEYKSSYSNFAELTSPYQWISNGQLTKYNWDKSLGLIDNRNVLEPADDAATAGWGSDWRLPTVEEFRELASQCTWTFAIRNGFSGCLVTGPNGNSIFMPERTPDEWAQSTRYFYLTNTLYTENCNSAYGFYVRNLPETNDALPSSYLVINGMSRSRYVGLARPVRVKDNDHQNGSGSHFTGDKDW